MSNKVLTVKQQSFLDNLIECNGDAYLAGKKAGYAPTSITNTVKALKTEILEMAEGILAQSAPKAALKLVDIMDSSEPIPQGSMRLQAAQTILDRVGLAKTDKLDVNVGGSNGLFILPAKQETVIEGSYAEN
jgi:phage terminase small subunit